MGDQWYASRGLKKVGPLSTSQLKAWAASGRLRLTDTVWKAGTEKKVLAGKVKNLFPVPPIQPALPGAFPQASETPSRAEDPAEMGEAILVASPPDRIQAPDISDEMFPALATVLLAPLDTSAEPLITEPAPPNEKPTRPPPSPARKRRAIAVKGVTLLSQDGVSVSYRKKCSKCGFEDNCRSTMHIGQGITRVDFFCPKCRKTQASQIQGVMQ